jgi:redox-sensing transcriptional repressor
MDDVKTPVIPRPTLQRLPAYLAVLKRMGPAGDEQVACTYIAERLGLDAVQVRKDLQFTGVIGRPRVGYTTTDLIAAIESTLGWDNFSDAFLVGAGNMGAALLGHAQLRSYGLQIVAAFDTDKTKVGTTLQGKKVFALAKLPELAKRMHIHIGIITVPAEAAQSVAELLLEGGIRAIWNFAPTSVTVPPDVIVENADLSRSLAVLTGRLTAATRHSA